MRLTLEVRKGENREDVGGDIENGKRKMYGRTEW